MIAKQYKNQWKNKPSNQSAADTPGEPVSLAVFVLNELLNI
jgi:hypothetical protein